MEPSTVAFARESASGYVVETFTERERPDLALRAQQLQAECYLAEGYVHSAAITSDGCLQPDIDRSRGPRVRYFVAMDRAGDVHAAARMVSASADEGLNALPGYERSRDRLDPRCVRRLTDAVTARGPSAVVELTALAKATAAPSIASFEVMRAIYQSSMQAPAGPPMWLSILVPNTYRSLCRNFGTSAPQRAGADAIVGEGDPRRAAGLRVTPVIVDPRDILDSVLDSARQASDPQAAARYVRGLVFLADGLPAECLSPAVHAALEQLADLGMGRA